MILIVTTFENFFNTSQLLSGSIEKVAKTYLGKHYVVYVCQEELIANQFFLYFHQYLLLRIFIEDGKFGTNLQDSWIAFMLDEMVGFRLSISPMKFVNVRTAVILRK